MNNDKIKIKNEEYILRNNILRNQKKHEIIININNSNIKILLLDLINPILLLNRLRLIVELIAKLIAKEP